MCNKTFTHKNDIKIDLLEHEMQQISVDNEYFYSDHIIVRKPEILLPHQYRQVFQFAMPHEHAYLDYKLEVTKSDKYTDNSELYSILEDGNQKRVKLRRRSNSLDICGRAVT